MFCKNCGSNIDDRAVICPKCGVLIRESAEEQSTSQDKTNVLAIVGFVLSFFVSLAGLICSIIARKQCRETGEKGSGLATAGMIISVASMVLEFFIIIAYIVVIMAAL